MIGAGRLGDIVRQDRARCAWPECSALADAQGFCRKHGMRLKRGGRVGCESQWEQLVAAALGLAAAETEAEYDKAAELLDETAMIYSGRRAPYQPRRRAGDPLDPAVEKARDLARAKRRLAARGIDVSGGGR